MVVEMDASGVKVRTVTDTNGYFRFTGLSAGRVILNLVLEKGGLPTNPNVVANLTGHNNIEVELGFFPPAPKAEGWQSYPALAVPEAVPAGLASVELRASTAKASPGQAVDLSLEVTNRHSAALKDVTLTLSLPETLLLGIVETTQGTINIAQPEAGQPAHPPGRTSALPSSGAKITVNIGSLAPGQTVFIKAQTQVSAAAPELTIQLQAELTYEGGSVQSNVATIALAKGAGEAVLAPTSTPVFAAPSVPAARMPVTGSYVPFIPGFALWLVGMALGLLLFLSRGINR